MIPQSAIHIDGNRAWLVVSSPVGAEVALDRTCDTCYTADGEPGDSGWQFCTDCDGTGRHTFDIEVEADVHWDAYRVHVVPGMVLPIVAWGQRGDSAPPYLVTQLPRPMATLITADRIAKKTITLPPDACPGMWAVQLEVHTPENVDGPT